jgi:hypothetical protein
MMCVQDVTEPLADLYRTLQEVDPLRQGFYSDQLNNLQNTG